MLIKKFRVVAWHGPQNSIRDESYIDARSFHEGAKLFAEAHGESIYSGRWEQPTDCGGVYSFGWTGHGLRIWVYEY